MENIEINNDAFGILYGDFEENEISDLFENPENLPIEIQSLLNDFEEKDTSYLNCKKLLKKCEKLGYSFEYGLDAIPYGLKKL